LLSGKVFNNVSALSVVEASEVESSRAALEGVEYQQLVDSAFSKAVDWLRRHEGNVIVLAPCGCSRGELLKRFLKPGEQTFSRAFVYRGFEVKGVEQSVDVYKSLDDLIGKLKAREKERVAVVTESSLEAVKLKLKLEHELPGARVELLYLPELYEDAAKKFSEEIRKLAQVEHERLKEAYKVEAKGYSSKLLREWGGGFDEVMRGKRAILALSLGELGWIDYAREAAEEAALAIAVAPLKTVLKHTAILILLYVAVELSKAAGLLGQLALDLGAIILSVLTEVAGVPALQLGNLLKRVIRKWWSKPDARNKPVEVVVKLIEAAKIAKEAAPYLDREELETVVDQVALEWGVSVNEFKLIVRNLAKISESELATKKDLEEPKSELERAIERVLDELEKQSRELEELKVKVEGLQIGVELLSEDDLESGSLRFGLKVEENKLLVVSTDAEAELVTTGRFGELAEEVLKKLKEGFLVLEGPKGIGKSTLAWYSAWLALARGEVDAILHTDKLRIYLPLRGLVNEAGGRRFLVLYDLSPPLAYYKPEYAGEVREAVENAERTLRELFDLAGKEERVMVLAVLPGDVYQSLSAELRGGIERFTLRVDLRDSRFLGDVVKAYSGCGEGFEKLVEKIKGFKGGYTLVARYAGLTLREKNCRVEDVEKALEEAKGEPKLFLAYYLWSAILNEDEDLAKKAAAPLILHAAFGPIPEGITYITKATPGGGVWHFLEPSQLKNRVLESLKEGPLEPIARWLSVLHEDLVEEMLKEVCGFKGPGAKERYRKLKLVEALEWASKELRLSQACQSQESVENALLKFVSERLEHALEAYSSRWQRLALILGSALSGQYSGPRVAMEAKRLPSDALESCGADSYLLVDNVISPLILRIAISRPSSIASSLAPACRPGGEEKLSKEIKDLENKWRERGRIYFDEVLYALGLAVAEAVNRGGSISVEEAEAALSIAVPTVQRAFTAENTAAILGALIPLADSAPHYYILLLSLASEPMRLPREVASAIHKVAGYLLKKHGVELRERAWPLAEAVNVYANLLIMHKKHFSRGERKSMRETMCSILEELEGQLRVVAEAYALWPAFVKGFEPCGGGEPVGKAKELLRKLERMEREEPDGQAREWVVARSPVRLEDTRLCRERFELMVKMLRGKLAYSLAAYAIINDDLEAAQEIFKEAVEIRREIEDWFDYLIARSMATRCSLLRARSLEDLKNESKILEEIWMEAEEREREGHWAPTVRVLEGKAFILAGHLVHLALEGRGEEVSRLLSEKGWLFAFRPEVGVAARLLLRILGAEVEEPEPREIAKTLEGEPFLPEFLPAFNVLMGLQPIEYAEESCKELEGGARVVCLRALEALCGDEVAVTLLKCDVLDILDSEIDLLGELAQRYGEQEIIERFRSELGEFVVKRGVNDVLLLFAPITPLAGMVLMLWTLSREDEELARAHAKRASIELREKLPRRLFREAAEARSEEEFKLALLKLFYLHF
jgi:hypothetical protein